MSKAKAQGTRHESWIVRQLEAVGIPARRLAEGGSGDEGDALAHMLGEEVVFEAKARQTLNLQDTIAKTEKKAGTKLGIVVWKRLVRVPGKARRQPVAGVPVMVAMSWPAFLRLLEMTGACLDKDATVKGEEE